MIIKNGIVATASDTFIADILIEDGKIVDIGQNIEITGHEIIDASGMFVIPGGVDVHTHFDLDAGAFRARDDFYTGTVAAACGGNTSIVDHMAFGPKGCNLKHQVNEYHKLADDKAVIDYGFHGVIQHVNDEILYEMEELIEEGITSYKAYLTYDYRIEDSDLYKILKRTSELGLLLTVHAENHGIVTELRSEYIKNGLTSPIYHAKSRPVECEGEAVERILAISKVLNDAPIYIVHVSSELGLSNIKIARERGQKNIFSETCPQYLFLNEELYNLPNNEGLKYIMSPPLRSEYNSVSLWNGIINNQINTIATDHCPFYFKSDKQNGKDDFTKCPNGAPGVELRIPLMFSEGVMKNRFSINKLVELCSTNPAKLFGLYPNKGTIAIGSDGDITIIDPNKVVKVTKSILHENVDYTPYENVELLAYPIMTISRGEIIVKDSEFLGEKGRGKFIKRNKPILCN